MNCEGRVSRRAYHISEIGLLELRAVRFTCNVWLSIGDGGADAASERVRPGPRAASDGRRGGVPVGGSRAGGGGGGARVRLVPRAGAEIRLVEAVRRVQEHPHPHVLSSPGARPAPAAGGGGA